MIENYFILMAKILLVAYTFARFEPMKMVLDLLPDKLFWNFIRLMLICSKCLALWIGLVMSGDIFIGMAASFIMTIFEKTLGTWIDQVKLN
jgi:type III secretory pathway component EscT